MVPDAKLDIHDGPDAFYDSVGTNLSGFNAIMYRLTVRSIMNRKVATIRG